jgi:hypothetical protein
VRASPAGTPLEDPNKYQSANRDVPATSTHAFGRASAAETSAPNIAP